MSNAEPKGSTSGREGGPGPPDREGGPGPPVPDGGSRPRRRRPLWEEEPFATIVENPRRFAWGVPAVFFLSIGAGLPFAQENLSVAIAIQLVLQTGGLLWLYIPVARERWRRERAGEGGARREREARSENEAANG